MLRLNYVCLRLLILSTSALSLVACSKLFDRSSKEVITIPQTPSSQEPPTSPQPTPTPAPPGSSPTPGNGRGGGNPGQGSPSIPGGGAPGAIPAPGPGQGPGWGPPSNPGGGGWNGSPGNGFDPGKPMPGTGPGGVITDELFEDFEVGVRFRCPVQKCFVKRFIEKDTIGETERFGVIVKSEIGNITDEPFFRVERILKKDGKRIGHVPSDRLLRWLEQNETSRSWRVSPIKVSGRDSITTHFENLDTYMEEFWFNDSQDGLVRTNFSIKKSFIDDTALGYVILHSIEVDLDPPILNAARFSTNTISGGSSVLLEVDASDSFGLNYLASLQEAPARLSTEIEPDQLYSWIGYRESFQMPQYSTAFAFPLVLYGAGNNQDFVKTNSGFSLRVWIPGFAKAGDLVLGGLKLRDRYGHETKINALNKQNGSYNDQYFLSLGSLSDNFDKSLRTLSVSGPATGKNADTQAPVFKSGSFLLPEISGPQQVQCLKLDINEEDDIFRFPMEFFADGRKLKLPNGCLEDTHITKYEFNLGKLELCYNMSPCFVGSGLPKNKIIELRKLVLYDGAGNRSEAIVPANTISFVFKP